MLMYSNDKRVLRELILMRSANKVILVDAMYGANLNARKASRAKRIIDGCKVAFHLNRSVGASLLALHASNASVCAELASDSTLIVIGALNNYLYGIVYKLDDVVGTFANAHAASNTLLRVYLCNAIRNGDSISGTNTCTVAITKASVVTSLITVIEEICGYTALKAFVVILSFGCVAVTVTSNVCNLFNNVLSFNAKNVGNRCRGLIAAGNAEVCFAYASLCQCLCIAVTTGIAARTTVCTGQACSDGNRCFVFLYAKKACG